MSSSSLCSAVPAAVVGGGSSWNVNAKEFTPGGPVLRAEAPAFVPLMSVASQIRDLIEREGVSGVKISQLPARYAALYEGKAIDLSGCAHADLSTLVASFDDVIVVEAAPANVGGLEIKTLAQAMQAAGFNVAVEDAAEEPLTAPADAAASVPLGADADKTAKLAVFANYVEDLKLFKQSIIDVVHNFSLKSLQHMLPSPHTSSAGLALSLFAAEWDRYHLARHIPMSDLKFLRERFGVAKLMPFLQAVPELDVVGTHPEVRVRIKHGVVCRPVPPSPRKKLATAAASHNQIWFPTTPSPMPSPDTSTYDGYSSSGARNISLNSELFGDTDHSAPTTPAAANAGASPEAQTRLVLEQMLGSTQSQILGILSQVPADPLAAASAIEQMNQLQVLVNALKAALAVLPPAAAATPAPPSRASSRTSIRIEDALFGPSPVQAPRRAPSTGGSTKQKISLDAMLSPAASPPQSPLSAAANAAPAVGPLLADLSRILFAQVIQQQHETPTDTVNETTAALERTLAELVSAASSPPSSPANAGNNDTGLAADSSSLVAGQLIIPKSLPSSPIPVAELSPSPALNLSACVDDEASSTATMNQLLQGLMSALPQHLPVVPEGPAPPGLVGGRSKSVVDVSAFDLEKRIYGKNSLIRLIGNAKHADAPAELQGLTCKQVLRCLPARGVSERPRKTETAATTVEA